MRKDIQYLDIFGQPIKRTYEARVKEYSRLIDTMQNCNLITCPDKIGLFSYLCHAGFVSPRVASYFLAGRVSPRHRNVLSCFLNFLHDIEGKNDLSDIVLFSQKFLTSWHATLSTVAVESTFQSPLAELAFSDPLFGTDFSKELVDYGL